MLDDFLLRAALAGIALALVAGPLGCFVIWRRMAYFGEATAHAAILGVALSLAFQTNIFVGTLGVTLLMALGVSRLAGRGWAFDTALGVLAHAALAFGLIAVSLVQGARLDLTTYLFGDILAVSKGDLAVIWGGVLAVLALLLWRWPGLITAALNEELAHASGIDTARERVVLTITLAIVVAVAIKIVGALLIVALLIIPAAASSGLSRTPEGMAIGATLIAVASALGGLWASLQFDTPAGPNIVAVSAVIFAGALLVGRRT